MTWSILYRGPLSSCNYRCGYCPFAKTRNTREELADDAARLGRFVRWCATRPQSLGILFTPWGEALVRPHYRDAFTRLSHLPNVHRVAAQTNLSFRPQWLDGVARDTAALWATFHPDQVPRSKFVARCLDVHRAGIRLSVGAVGTHQAIDSIEALREELPDEIYVWVNAFKRLPEYYTPQQIERLVAVDPLFEVNNRRHHSLGARCRTGDSVFSVDGEGDARRCHFVSEPFANIYEPDFATRLRPRPCPNETCGCHIGYVHMDRLGLYDVFGEGVLERIPSSWATDFSITNNMLESGSSTGWPSPS